jgi:hypothetical protein
MKALFASGRIVDLILAGMILEAAVLLAWSLRGGPRPGTFLPMLVSGMFLLLALRAALSGAWWGWVGACLSGALLGHLADLRRLRRR